MHRSTVGHRSGRLVSTLLGALAGCLVLAACEGGSVPEQQPLGMEGAGAAAGAQDDPPAAAAEAPSSTISLAFAGDVHFELGLAGLPARPGSTLGPVSRTLRQADLAMVNLESALAGPGEPARKELEDPARRYWFRTPPAALGLLARSGVDVVSMANNHAADYGAAGLRETLRAAQDGPVAVVGVGKDPERARRPHRVEIDGTRVAVLAADASPRESADPTWAVERGRGPGIAAARTPDAPLLLASVREAARTDDVVVVYLHWGEENEVRPTGLQRGLAASLAKAGADVVVGSHAHRLQGAGMIGDTYVSYGLGNFAWYHGRQPATGVLRVDVTDGRVSGARLEPAVIPAEGGRPVPLVGRARDRAVTAWQRLRATTDLEAAPRASKRSKPSKPSKPAKPSKAAEPYQAQVRRIGTELRARMVGSSHRAGCPVGLDDLRHLRLTYRDFRGVAQRGSLIVHEDVAEDVVAVFGSLYRARFPIERMRLVDAYGADDDRSMAANNTSGYNCRRVAGSASLSDHAYGRAVDINPVQNPYLTGGRVLPPAGRDHASVGRDAGSPRVPGVIRRGDVVTRAFDRVGWTWGGDWQDPDYQHFSAR